MPIRYSPNGTERNIVSEMEVTNNHGRRWIKLIVIKLPAVFGGIASFAFYAPQLAAEGSGFATPEQAVASGVKLILGLILLILAALA